MAHKSPGRKAREARRAAHRAETDIAKSQAKALSQRADDHASPGEKPEPKCGEQNPPHDSNSVPEQRVDEEKRSLLSSGWTQNLVVSALFASVAPVVGIFLKDPRTVIIGSACGLTVVVWVIAVLLLRSPSVMPRAAGVADRKSQSAATTGVTSLQTLRTGPTIEEEITRNARVAMGRTWQPPELPSGAQYFVIKFGGMTSEYPISRANSEGEVMPWVRLDGAPEIIPYIKTNRIYLKASNPFGEPNDIVKMNTEWDSKIPVGWDRNYSPTKFEIVDHNGLPVMQVEYVRPDQIHVFGIFVSERGYVTVAFGGSTHTTAPGISIPDIPARKAWFKYPSKDHLGEYADK